MDPHRNPCQYKVERYFRIKTLALAVAMFTEKLKCKLLFFHAFQLYPPDMAMVFNPQNPNAPPIYPCGVCHKEVHDNDQAIPCESGCNFWFHR
jgi:hypothetical protein